MPRGGRSGGSSRSPPRSTTPTTSRPMTQQPQQPPVQTQQQSKPGMFSGFGSTLVQGMAFGAGSEVAHQAIRSVMGGSSHSQQQPVQQEQVQQTQQMNNQQICQNEIANFTNCLNTNSNIGYCQSYSDMLKQCQQKYK